MCILLNVKKHEKTFALNVDIFNYNKNLQKRYSKYILICIIVNNHADVLKGILHDARRIIRYG